MFDLFSGGLAPGAALSGSAYCDRTAVWTQVLDKLGPNFNAVSTGRLQGPSTKPGPATGDYDILALFASGNNKWIDKVPFEWREIYGAIYDEAKHFKIAESQLASIGKDVHRTFGLFSRNLPHIRSHVETKLEQYYASLTSILIASSHERNYCQGYNFLAAAFLLSEANERDAFAVLCFVLRQRHLEILFNSKCSSLLEYMKLFEKKLRKHNKAVYNHFRTMGYSTVCYAIEWFTTCFIVTSPGLLSCCVLDLIVAGFEDIMIRIGLAVMDYLEVKILESSLEALQENFRLMVTTVDVSTVMLNALILPLDRRQNALQVRTLDMSPICCSRLGDA
jgi:hypothetical protein